MKKCKRQGFSGIS